MVKVKKPFIDRYTNNMYSVDEILDIDEKRIEEIQSVDPELIEVLPDEPAEVAEVAEVAEPAEPKKNGKGRK